jgi:hypothetical protein
MLNKSATLDVATGGHGQIMEEPEHEARSKEHEARSTKQGARSKEQGVRSKNRCNRPPCSNIEKVFGGRGQDRVFALI